MLNPDLDPVDEGSKWLLPNNADADGTESVGRALGIRGPPNRPKPGRGATSLANMDGCEFALLFVPKGEGLDTVLFCVVVCGSVGPKIEGVGPALLSKFVCGSVEGKIGGNDGGLVPEAECPVKAGRPGRFARSVEGFAIPGVGARIGMMCLLVVAGALVVELFGPALVASFLLRDRSSASRPTMCSSWRS